MKKIFKRTFKTLPWIFGSVIVLFFLLVLLIQVPRVQNLIKKKAVFFIENKIGTPVRIDNLKIALPKKIVLKGFYFEDQKQDTLLAGERLAIDISLFKLLHKEIQINSIKLQGLTTTIVRSQDSVFNFDYVVNAFSSKIPSDTSSSSIAFVIHKIYLEDIQFGFDDAISKINIRARLGHFSTQFEIFNLEEMVFDIPETALDGLITTIKQGSVEKLPAILISGENHSDPTPINIDLKLGKIDLSSIDVFYYSEDIGMQNEVHLGNLNVDFNRLDVLKEVIDIKNIKIDGLNADNIFGKRAVQKLPVQDTVPTNNADSSPNNWKVAVEDLSFADINFSLTDENVQRIKNGIDFNHINVSDLKILAKNIDYSSDKISGRITDFSAQEQNGFIIQTLQTDFLYSDTTAYLKNLLIQTPQTTIRNSIALGYPSLASIKSDPGELAIEVNLEKSAIGFKDILLLSPDFKTVEFLKNNADAIILLDGNITGNLNNLTIPKFEISGLKNTAISMNGSIIGLPDAAISTFDVHLSDFTTTSQDLHRIAPEGTFPDNLSIPSQIVVNGTFKGTKDAFQAEFNARTSYGDMVLNATFDATNENKEKYTAQVSISELQLGQLLQNDSIGSITINAKVNGTGLNPRTATVKASGSLVEGFYNGYLFQNLDFEGSIAQGIFNLDIGMTDPNLDFQIASTGSINGAFPSIKINGEIKNIALHTLNLSDKPLLISGAISADVATLSPDHLNGEILFNRLLVTTEGQQIPLNKVSIRSTATTEKNSLKINSPFIKASLEGKYQLMQLGTDLPKTISKYYTASTKIPDKDVTVQKIKPQRCILDATIKADPLLSILVPKLELLNPIAITGNYDTEIDNISINVNIPNLKYNANKISDADFRITARENALDYALTIKEVNGGSISIPNIKLTGNIKKNAIFYDFQIKDAKDRLHYQVTGNVATQENKTTFTLDPGTLLLDYNSWEIPNNNMIIIATDGILATNFELSYQQNAITINSQNQKFNAPLEIGLRSFNIATITKMVSNDTLLVGGVINGQVVVAGFKASPTLKADLAIDDFTFRNDTLGNLHIKANNPTSETIKSEVALSGFGNQMNFNGFYNTKNSVLDYTLDIKQLNIQSLEGFTSGNLTESSGFFSGNLKITGSIEQPRLDGDLKFNDIAFRVTPLNASFKRLNDTIQLNHQGIRFDKFSLSDINNNRLIVNGTILTTNYTDLSFGLTIHADNFQAINSTAADNDLYYGKLFLNTNLQIKGTMESPSITGSIAINESTKLTLVLPQGNPSIADRKGVVEFVDETSLELKKTKQIKDDFASTELRGLTIAVNVSIDPKATFKVIIDEANGDNLNLKGNAQLSFGIDPSGNTSLIGRYEFSEGAYEMSFNFIKRKFDIEKGSFILWSGDPSSPDINITAIYETEAAPIDLVENQIGHLTGSARNVYKQSLPFQTILQMKGTLLQPEITFDIRIPERNYNIPLEVLSNSRTKLAQLRQRPAELNKQVFALLILNRFIGENPFASEAGGINTEIFARQSVSKILSRQLNNLASDLIAGVDLEFDLESSEAYSTGQPENRTDLNVGLSKKLFNERLKVTIGSSFELEGSQNNNENANNIAGDITVDYLLSKDGRYCLQAFRKNEYQVALQGQIIETGLAFIIMMEYDTFKEFFQRKQDK